MKFSPIFILALAGYNTAKKVGDICGTDFSKGVCEPTSWCNSRHGTVSESGLSPSTDQPAMLLLS